LIIRRIIFTCWCVWKFELNRFSRNFSAHKWPCYHFYKDTGLNFTQSNTLKTLSIFLVTFEVLLFVQNSSSCALYLLEAAAAAAWITLFFYLYFVLVEIMTHHHWLVVNADTPLALGPKGKNQSEREREFYLWLNLAK